MEFCRSRDEDVLSMCNIVVDVGGEYNHAAMKYDHHQRDFSHTMNTLQIMNFGTKLSSAGLIYAHFGKNVIGALLGLSHNDTVIDILFKKVYEIFVEAIDAIDNGIAQFDGEPRYYLGGTLSSRVSMLNPAWNEDLISYLNELTSHRFIMAVKLVDKEFSELLTYLYKSWLPARSIVVNAVVHRFNVDKSGQIFLLEAGGVPWKDHFFTLKSNFTLPLPEAWRGLRDAELTKVADIPGCIFVHPTGFIGGNKSLQGVLEMARKSLSLAGKYKN
ncbi:Metal-dependent protein hydrolase [Dirofilaria immitis]|nr:Metal-dependent protein hydrolase [Dirofilaria immitis]